MLSAPEGREIAAAVTNLAHVLGKSVTAEVVETEHQRHAVAEMGCVDLTREFFQASEVASRDF